MAKFPKSCRMVKKREFDLVFTEGKKIVQGTMVAFVLKRESGAQARLGVVASKKVGNAVVRNKLKRYFREAFRVQDPANMVGFDLVIVARKRAQSAKFTKIQAAFDVIFKQMA